MLGISFCSLCLSVYFVALGAWFMFMIGFAQQKMLWSKTARDMSVGAGAAHLGVWPFCAHNNISLSSYCEVPFIEGL